MLSTTPGTARSRTSARSYKNHSLARYSMTRLGRFCQLGSRLAIVDHKRVVISKLRPWAGRDIFKIDKFPISHIRGLQAKVIAHRRGHVQASALVQVRFGPLVP